MPETEEHARAGRHAEGAPGAPACAECAITPVGDDVLRHVLGRLVERGFDVMQEAKR